MQSSQILTENDTWKKKSKSKRKHRTFQLLWKAKDDVTLSFYNRWKDWKPYYKKYLTAEERDQACQVLNHKDSMWEYKPAED
jgi:hypothetical protein